MTISFKCKFYRDSGGIAIGRGLGYCDFDGYQTICEGDIQFCEKRETLKQYVLDQKNRREGLGKYKS